jgi:TM2 domain-containing membrane protein YozV
MVDASMDVAHPLPSRDQTRSDLERISMTEGQGSSGNVLAAICSFFIPGLGQLVQGRLLMAIIMFVLAAVLWIILLGWLIHLWSILDAALYKPNR